MNRALCLRVIFLLLTAVALGRGNSMPSQDRPLEGQNAPNKKIASDRADWYPTLWGQSFRPPSGIVPDEKTAITIAEAVLVPIYGDQDIKAQKPFKVTLQNNIWLIEGALPDPPEPRGTFVLRLSKRDGKVLFLTHYQ
jgi:hypothetical protein